MTVTYFNGSNWMQLLLKWKGSIWKTIWKTLLGFVLIYLLINLSYRFAMNEEQQLTFEKTVRDVAHWEAVIPYKFIMMTFVTFVLSRFMSQYFYLAYIDQMASLITVAFPEKTEESLMLRRQLIRYIAMMNYYYFRQYSAKGRIRIPTSGKDILANSKKDINDTMEYSGLSNPTESIIDGFMTFKQKMSYNWALSMVMRQHWNGKCTERIALELLHSINNMFNTLPFSVFTIDVMVLPIIYVQVFTVVTYFLLAVSLISGQVFVVREGGDLGPIFPVFTLIRVLFAVGGLKVGEEYISGFGNKDDSFEVNCFSDRMLAVGMFTVDKLADECPPQEKDIHFDDRYFIPYHTYSSLTSLLKHDYYCPQSRLDNWNPSLKETEITSNTHDLNP